MFIRKLKEERRKQQEDNIERKKLIKEKHKLVHLLCPCSSFT